MLEEIRTLLYPLGFLSSLVFGLRMLLQWLQSEVKGQCTVTRFFWILSILGNTLLTTHSFIQKQFYICLIQACSGVIAWRNLNLMQTQKPPLSFKKILFVISLTALLVTLGFVLQLYFFQEKSWMRTPLAPWQATKAAPVPFLWHLVGTIGYFLFSSRFFIQWWLAEKKHKSILPLSFWWMSLLGAFTSSLYFMRIHDMVNLIGPVLGFIPYIRNLMLLYNSPKLSQTS